MISIIIVTYNSASLIQDCLTSTLAATKLACEIIIVDNASSDNTLDSIDRSYSDLRLICQDTNLGFSSGVNRGLAVARGEYLLLLNPDVILELESLDYMVAFLEQHPETGIVGAQSRTGMWKTALTAYGPYTPLSIVWKYVGLDYIFPYIVFGQYRYACETAKEPFKVRWVQGSCMMIRRAVVEQIGMFDEQFFLFSEETDYCARAIELGWDIAYIPQAKVTHLESSTVSQYPDLKTYYHHLSPLYYFRKRGDEISVLFLKFGFTIELLIKSTFRLFQWIVGRDSQAHHRLTIYRSVLRDSWLY